MPFYSVAFLCVAVLVPFAHVRADSAAFSQFIGATTASGPSSGDLVPSFNICTNYLHGLPALTSLQSSYSTQIEQMAVDGVCRFCTGLDQSRIDSCCGQATSSACFDQFAGANTARTTPASASATRTATSAGGSSVMPTNSSNRGVIARKDTLAGSFVAVMKGLQIMSAKTANRLVLEGVEYVVGHCGISTIGLVTVVEEEGPRPATRDLYHALSGPKKERRTVPSEALHNDLVNNNLS
ncbi:hypothetical protein GJ744_006083 [Endocarpon pusillum]|uniref:GPI-anchored surface protein n=1 Tax=Endocarpon pusillum TaxID=364733 RepID=A0A8H7E636_9EURO|nr:hypothetical protein GJ744_006083 [Endocarpon pusillum]